MNPADAAADEQQQDAIRKQQQQKEQQQQLTDSQLDDINILLTEVSLEMLGNRIFDIHGARVQSLRDLYVEDRLEPPVERVADPERSGYQSDLFEQMMAGPSTSQGSGRVVPGASRSTAASGASTSGASTSAAAAASSTSAPPAVAAAEQTAEKFTINPKRKKKNVPARKSPPSPPPTIIDPDVVAQVAAQVLPRVTVIPHVNGVRNDQAARQYYALLRDHSETTDFPLCRQSGDVVAAYRQQYMAGTKRPMPELEPSVVDEAEEDEDEALERMMLERKCEGFEKSLNQEIRNMENRSECLRVDHAIRRNANPARPIIDKAFQMTARYEAAEKFQLLRDADVLYRMLMQITDDPQNAHAIDSIRTDVRAFSQHLDGQMEEEQ